MSREKESLGHKFIGEFVMLFGEAFFLWLALWLTNSLLGWKLGYWVCVGLVLLLSLIFSEIQQLWNRLQ